MATLNPKVIALGGVTPTYTPAGASGDKVAPGERVFLHVKNGAASPVTVTLAATAKLRGQAVTSPTVTVAASGESMIGPLSADLLAGATDGLVAISYSSNTSVTVAALRI